MRRCLLLFSLMLFLSACPAKNPAGLYTPSSHPDLHTRTQFHAQIMSEMAEVVLLQPIDGEADIQEFRQWVSALNSGASLEGVYNGLTHSNHYRNLEVRFKGASSQAHATFLREILIIQEKLSPQSVFDQEAAGPLPLPLDLRQENGLSFQSQGPVQKKTRQSGEDLRALFAQSSFFTLKRVLGEEVVKLMSQLSGQKKKSSLKKMATWYGSWAARSAELKIDFGLDLRNRNDAQFHQNWAEGVQYDLVLWEALNRIHRILNHAQSEGLSHGT